MFKSTERLSVELKLCWMDVVVAGGVLVVTVVKFG